MSTTWRTAPAFYRARYAALGSTLPLLPARKTSPTTTPFPLPARSSGDGDFAPQRTRRPLAATFLGRYPTHRCDKPKLRRRTLLLAACGVLAWCALVSAAPSSWSSKRAPRAYRSLLASSASRRQPRLVVLRPLTAVGSRAAPPPEAEATAAAHVASRMAPPPIRTSLRHRPPRATLIAPEQSSGVLSGASRLAVLHFWVAYAMLGCVAAAAAASVAHGLLQRRRSVIERDDDHDDASESSDYDDDDEFDRESDHPQRAEGSSSSDNDLFRVLYSSDPAEIGYAAYGSFGRWSPASTLVSVDAKASAAAASSSSSPTSCASTWTGDYFDKFDV